ncbi:unnamed protein product, partial [Prunus brigantina]
CKEKVVAGSSAWDEFLNGKLIDWETFCINHLLWLL